MRTMRISDAVVSDDKSDGKWRMQRCFAFAPPVGACKDAFASVETSRHVQGRSYHVVTAS